MDELATLVRKGGPVCLLCYERDSLRISMRKRLDAGDAYFNELRSHWNEGIRTVFKQLPKLTW